MKIKKIFHLITTIERGGAENQLLILVNEQINKGFKVEIIYLKGNEDLKKDFEDLGVKVNNQIANRKFTRQVLYLRNYFTNNKSLVHAHLPRAEVMAFLTLKKNSFIITRHNYEQFWPSMPKLFSSVLSRLVCSKAAGGIAISRSLKEYLIHNLEVSKHFPLEVVYYGYSKKLDPKVDAEVEFLKSYDLALNVFKIGIISRLVPGKDYPTLFKALKLVLANDDKIKLLIVGDGYQKQYLSDLSKKMGIENNVIWLGKINFVSEFLLALDLFVFTSRGEGFGLVLLEAMKASRPILAANNSAIPEVLGEKYEGLFRTGNHVELAEKIIKAIKIRDYSTELVKSYLPQLEIFNPQVMAARTIEMYEYYGF